ncbi:MAG TPA: hypothetical protein VH442_15030 [Micromonosporaceae bacterium]
MSEAVIDRRASTSHLARLSARASEAAAAHANKGFIVEAARTLGPGWKSQVLMPAKAPIPTSNSVSVIAAMIASRPPCTPIDGHSRR